jgi:cob(I)alamin adenosyltransferase
MAAPMKYYTTTGDDGTTGLLGEGRVKKYHPRPDAYGTVDEAQAALGVARAAMQDRAAAEVILQVQRDLYHLMAELAATKDAAAQFRRIDAARVAWLGAQTDLFGDQLTLPREFTVTGDSLSGAYLDLARAIVRRAERLIVKMADDALIENRDLLRYLNRLSALCFVLSRREDALSGQGVAKLSKVAAPKSRKRKV